VARFLHTMVRITDPERSRAFYEALGFTFDRDMDIVRDGRSYDLGTGYGHIAVGVDDLDGTLERLTGQGIEPERPPYQVREGGSRLCFVQDPDGYRIELIGRS
jgi:lactoylglutathione lyase